MDSKSANSLTSLVEKVGNSTKDDPVELGEIIKNFRYRGFGPLLLIPVLLIMLPTVAIPGIPAICGFLMALISAQIVMGYEHPWIPKKLKMFSVSKRKLETGLKKLRTLTKKIDYYLDHRFTILTEKACQRLAGIFTFLLSLFIIFIGFIPFIPALFSLPIFFFALGYTVHDGLLIALGFLCVGGAAAGAPFLLGG